MDAAAGLTFASPRLLLLLAALPFAAVFLYLREKRRRSVATAFVSERLRGAPAWRGSRPLLLTLALALAVVAAAGPQLGTVEVEIPPSNATLAIVFDTSLSMKARDVGATRLDAGKGVVKRILERFDGRAGLVVFEGGAEIVAPLTLDIPAVTMLLETLGAGELPEPGSNLSDALHLAMQLVEKGGGGDARIVVVTDGENRAGDPGPAAEAARRRGITVDVVVIGTEEASTIPGDRGPMRDGDRDVIYTRADLDAMTAVAARGGGRLYHNPFDEASLARIASRGVERGDGTAERREIPRERYQYPLGAALLLFIAASFVHRGAE
jgi:Ca-activated chloride channel homolog